MSSERYGREVPDPVDWDDPEQVAVLRWLCSQENPEGLSALARHVLGYDFFDMAGSIGRVRTKAVKFRFGIWRQCGLVPYGPHRTMLHAITSTKNVFLLCSRRAMKTTAIIARIVQILALDRNKRILCQMETKQMAEATVSVVGQLLESCEKLHRLFGTFRDKGMKWSTSAITVSGRTQVLRDPSLSAHGGNTRAQGNRCDIFILDDPIGHQTARSPDQVEKAYDTFIATLPQMDEGAYILGAMTPYTSNDLSQRASRDANLGIRVVRIDCGMFAHVRDDGSVYTTGYPRFPNHTKKRLEQEARANPKSFNLNYGLVVGSDMDQVFTRGMFRVIGYDPMRFQPMNAYLMTDTAVSDHDRACMSALAVVGLDHDDTAVVLDANVGFWSPEIFCEMFIAMFQRWASATRIVGMVMEQNAANRIYRVLIDREMQLRNLAARWILTPRSGRNDKSSRIKSLLPRLHTGKLLFADSIRHSFRFVNSGDRVLFSPTMVEVEGKMLPGGEIIDQFLNWRDHDGYDGIMDFPDALGDLDYTRSNGERLLLPTQRLVVYDDPEDLLAARFTALRGGRSRYDVRELRRGGYRDQPHQDDNGPAWKHFI